MDLAVWLYPRLQITLYTIVVKIIEVHKVRNFGGIHSTEPAMKYVFTSDMMISLGLEVTAPAKSKYCHILSSQITKSHLNCSAISIYTGNALLQCRQHFTFIWQCVLSSKIMNHLNTGSSEF